MVRFATVEDTENIIELLQEMQLENSIYPFATAKVRRMIHASFEPSSVMRIGVIGSSVDLEATIGLEANQPWWSEAYVLGDYWNYVRKDCRISTHADELLEFAKAYADKVGLDYISGVVSFERAEAKTRLYRRHFDTFLGGTFIHRHMNGISQNG